MIDLLITRKFSKYSQCLLASLDNPLNVFQAISMNKLSRMGEKSLKLPETCSDDYQEIQDDTVNIFLTLIMIKFKVLIAQSS